MYIIIYCKEYNIFPYISLFFFPFLLMLFLSLWKEDSSQKIDSSQVKHLSLEFYKADVEIGVSQHLGFFLLLNGMKSIFRKLNL